MFQKVKNYRNQKVRDHAKGQNCMMHLPGCINNTETTVFCHLNGSEWGKGTSLKSHDVGFFGCHYCHDIYDGRIKHDFDRDWLESQAHKATTRTTIILLLDGVLK
jgi:hypothetical protein